MSSQLQVLDNNSHCANDLFTYLVHCMGIIVKSIRNTVKTMATTQQAEYGKAYYIYRELYSYVCFCHGFSLVSITVVSITVVSIR